MMPVALFVGNDTLWPDVMPAWVECLRARGLFDREAAREMVLLTGAGSHGTLAREISLVKGSGLVARGLRGTSALAVELASNNFVAAHVGSRYWYVDGLLRSTREHRVSNVVISGAPQPVLEMFARLLPLDAVHGVRYTVGPDGCYDGGLERNTARPEVKAAVARQYQWCQCVLAAGDQIGDAPLRDASDHFLSIEGEPAPRDDRDIVLSRVDCAAERIGLAVFLDGVWRGVTSPRAVGTAVELAYAYNPAPGLVLNDDRHTGRNARESPDVFCSNPASLRGSLFETTHFVIKPDDSAFGPAHVLILPKPEFHVPCFGAAPPEWDAEVHYIIDRLRDFVAETLNMKLLIWENGVIDQSQKHAHLVALAVPRDFALPEPIQGVGVSGLAELRAHYGADHTYHYVALDAAQRILPCNSQDAGEISNARRRALRTPSAPAVNRMGWNWRRQRNPGLSIQCRTLYGAFAEGHPQRAFLPDAAVTAPYRAQAGIRGPSQPSARGNGAVLAGD